MRTYDFLTDEQVDHFLLHGWFKLENAFSATQAANWTKDVWRRLNIDPNEPSTWHREWINMPAINSEPVESFSPKAWAVMTEMLGGVERIHPQGRSWDDAFIVNFGSRDGEKCVCGESPRPYELNRWHCDGDSFLHFLDSPEQGMLVVPIFTEIKPSGGGTLVAPESIKIIARYLASHPEGVPLDEFDFLQIRDQCSEFIELTGKPGDVVLMHPFMLHTPTHNNLRVPRIITNPPIYLSQPFQLSRTDPSDYSLIELKTLVSLGADPQTGGFRFNKTAERRTVEPERVKEQVNERVEQIKRLESVG